MTIHIPSVNGEPAELEVQATLPDALPVLPLRDSVAFPDTVMPLAVGQERSIQLVNDVLGGNRMLVMVASKDPDNEEPGPDDLYRVGVVGVVARMLKVPDGTVRILVQCGQRVELGEFVATEPYLVARITEAPDEVVPSPELEALVRNVQGTFSRIIEELPYLPEELQMAVANIDDPAELAHMIAASLRIKTEDKQRLLEERDVTKRLRLLSEILARELELVEIGSRIQSQVQSEMDKGQREYFLRQQLRAIQEELGEVDEQEAEAQELRRLLEEANLPEHVWKVAERELGRFERLPPQSARARRDSHLPRVARLAAVVEVDRGQPRPEARAQGARPRPLRHRAREGPHPRVPRGPEAQARRAQLDRAASWDHPAWARPRSGARSPPPWSAASSACPWAACATSRRSAATAAPTSVRCRERSSARSATPARTTPC